MEISSKDIVEKALEAIEIAAKTGKIKKGSNEVTKVIERGTAKLVAIAADVNPPEIIMHIQPLCKEKNIPLVVIPAKEELGSAAGMGVSTAAVAIIDEGESKKLVTEIASKLK
jgi:large subunit ribosomal protein L7Ae